MLGNGKAGETRRHRVLIVDDHRLATHVLAGLLRRYAYEVAAVNDSTKAVQKARRFRPDIALIDLHMPWRSGHEVVADFASDELLCQIPIIFITANAVDPDASESSIPILVKPFEIEDLFARITEALAGKCEEVGPGHLRP